MGHLDRIREEFTRQADTFTVHAVKADKKMEATRDVARQMREGEECAACEAEA